MFSLSLFRGCHFGSTGKQPLTGFLLVSTNRHLSFYAVFFLRFHAQLNLCTTLVIGTPKIVVVFMGDWAVKFHREIWGKKMRIDFQEVGQLFCQLLTRNLIRSLPFITIDWNVPRVSWSTLRNEKSRKSCENEKEIVFVLFVCVCVCLFVKKKKKKSPNTIDAF